MPGFGRRIGAREKRKNVRATSERAPGLRAFDEIPFPPIESAVNGFLVGTVALGLLPFAAIDATSQKSSSGGANAMLPKRSSVRCRARRRKRNVPKNVLSK